MKLYSSIPFDNMQKDFFTFMIECIVKKKKGLHVAQVNTANVSIKKDLLRLAISYSLLLYGFSHLFVILCASLQKELKPSINERDNAIVKQLKAITVHCINYNYKLRRRNYSVPYTVSKSTSHFKLSLVNDVGAM